MTADDLVVERFSGMSFQRVLLQACLGRLRPPVAGSNNSLSHKRQSG